MSQRLLLIGLFLPIAAGLAGAQVTVSLPGPLGRIVAADVDGDGDDDLLTDAPAGVVRAILVQNGTFLSGAGSAVAPGLVLFFAPDLNADGLADVVTYGQPSFSVLLNTGGNVTRSDYPTPAPNGVAV